MLFFINNLHLSYWSFFFLLTLLAAASTIIAPFIAGGLVDLVSDYLGMKYNDHTLKTNS